MFAQIKAVPKPATTPAVANTASAQQPAAANQAYKTDATVALPASTPGKPLPRGSFLNILV